MTMPGRSGGQIRLDVVPDARLLGPMLVRQARTATNQAERHTKVKVTPDTRGFGPRLGRDLRTPLKSAGDTGRAAFSWLAAGTVAVGINRAIHAASSLNETVSKSRVVFGPASKMVEDFGATAAKSFGMSRQEAISNAATLGNMFVSMKIGQGQAAQMSMTMVKLAGDMASFNDASPQETLEAIRAGLVGETEPLRRFGVNLNEAALKAEAMRLGLGKIGPTLTATQRTQAAYSLILRQTTTAQGDYARTSDSLANRERTMAGLWKDTQATLGKGLLPVMAEGVAVVSRLAEGFSNLDESTGGLSTRLLLGGVAAAGLAVGVAKTVSIARDAHAAWIALRAAHVTTAAAATVQAGAETRLAASTAASGAAAAAAGPKILGTVAMLGALGAAAAAGAYQGTKQAESLGKVIQVSGPFADIRAKILRAMGEEAVVAKKLTGEQAANNAATAAGKEVSASYAEALKALGGNAGGASPKVAALTESIKVNREAIKANKEATTDAVLAYQGLIRQSDVTAAKVIEGIHNQVANFRTYSKDTQRLIRAGVSPAAIRELSQKGPEYVHALATGSNRQLNLYKDYWRQRQAEVKGSFADSLERQVQDLNRKIQRMQRIIDKLEGKNVPITSSLALKFSPSFTQKDWVQVRLLAGRMAEGGEVGDETPGMPGTRLRFGPKGRDTQLRWLDPREHVLTAAEVAAAGGHAALKRWRKALLSGEVPGLQAGGPVGQIRRKLPEISEVQAKPTARIMDMGLTKLLAQGGGGIGGLGGPGGWRWQMAVLRAAFPGIQLVSGYRPGAITATGNRSYHASGRAVDIPPNMAYFDWIRSRYGRNTRELIFTPAGNRQIWNGRPHVYRGVTARDHWTHIHWAYAQGAWKVLTDRLALIHRGEMVVPAKPAEDLRQAVSRGLGGAGLPADFYERLAAAIAANPPRVYLDRQEVTRAIGTGMLWESRR